MSSRGSELSAREGEAEGVRAADASDRGVYPPWWSGAGVRTSVVAYPGPSLRGREEREQLLLSRHPEAWGCPGRGSRAHRGAWDLCYVRTVH
jgi:hypothetical protein